MSERGSPSARASLARTQRTALTVFLSVFVGSWLIVGALLAPVVGGWPTIALAALALTAVPLAFLFRSRGRSHYPGKAVRLLVFRPMWYAQLLLILSALGGLAAAICGLPFGAAGVAGRDAIAGIAIVYSLFAIVGYAASRKIIVASLTVTLPSLPEALDGLRIAQICDTHIGPHTSRRRLARVAAAVREARPDLIAVVGDLIDDFAPDVELYAQSLGDLRAPLGVYIVAGNHEVYAGWSEVLPRLRALSHAVLVNESRVLAHRGVQLAIAGTGDPAAGRIPGPGVPAPDIAATLDGIPRGAFTIALAHNPALWPPLASAGVPLTLSGHTHWGQLSINRAGWSLANLFLELAMGPYRRGDSLLYVSPGTNYWGIPFRLGARAEVSILTLRRGSDAGISGAQSIDARTRRAPRGGSVDGASGA
jgi:predicted MPP superfamily phosphohydrolase